MKSKINKRYKKVGLSEWPAFYMGCDQNRTIPSKVEITNARSLPMCNTSISVRWIKGGNETFLHKGR